MARNQTRVRLGASAMAFLLLLSSVAGVPLVMADHTGDAIASDETIQVTENVDVWAGSILTLRTNTDDAAYTIPNAKWNLIAKGKQKSLNKPEIGVYNANTQMRLSFDVGHADGITANFDGKSVHLIAARTSPNLPENLNASTVSTENASDQNASDAMDLLTAENVNRNATFYDIDVTTLQNGKATFAWTPPQAGHYVFFLAFAEDGSSGIDVDESTHNVSVTSHTTIVGVEQALVHDKKSQVELLFKDQEYVVAGPEDKLRFGVDTSGMDGKNVTHTILVYDEETGFVDQEFTLRIDGEVKNWSDVGKNMTIESSVTKLSGVARINGDDTHVENESVTFSVQNFVNTLHTDTGLAPSVEYEPTVGGETLEGSMTTYVGGPGETIVVEMNEDWGPTNYRWVHVAISEDGEVQTNSGDFDLPIDNRDGGDGSGDGQNPDNNGGNQPAPPAGGGGGGGGVVNPPSTLTDVTSTNGKATIAITNVYKGKTVNVRFLPGQVQNDVFELEGIALQPGTDLANFEMSVTPLDAAPSGVPAVEDEMPAQALTYFQIGHSISNDDVNGVTYSFDVKKSSLNGQAPENVVLYRYHDGQWTKVTTRLVGQSGSSYEYEADSPGLSVYAIGVAQPDITVENADLKSSTIQVGDDAKVTVTVSNTGDGTGTETLELTADGSTLSETEITLEGGETRTITLTKAFDKAGTYEIAVNGNSAGTLTVEGSGTTEEGSDETSETPDEDSEGGLGAAAWFLILLIIVALGAGVLYIKRQQP